MKLNGLVKNKYSGYIALVSVIIISAIGSVLVASLMMVSISGLSANKSNREYEQAYFAAEGCAENAIIKLAKNNNYASGEVITYDNSECTVVAITGTGSVDRVIDVEGQAGTSIVRLRIDIASLAPEVQLNSWIKVIDF